MLQHQRHSIVKTKHKSVSNHSMQQLFSIFFTDMDWLIQQDFNDLVNNTQTIILHGLICLLITDTSCLLEASIQFHFFTIQQQKLVIKALDSHLVLIFDQGRLFHIPSSPLKFHDCNYVISDYLVKRIKVTIFP